MSELKLGNLLMAIYVGNILIDNTYGKIRDDFDVPEGEEGNVLDALYCKRIYGG